MKIIDFSVLLILIFATIFEVSSVTDDPQLLVRAKCREMLNLDEDNLAEAVDNPDNYGCYIFCFFQELNIMDDKGVGNADTATMTVREDLRDVARADITTCFDLNNKNLSGDTCQDGLQVIQCFKEKSPMVYQMLGIFRPPQSS